MKPAKYLSLNGKLKPSSEPCLMHYNRGLLYGDTFNINCRGTSSQIFFFDLYFELIISQLEKMKMQIPKLLKPEILKTDIELLLQKNRIYQGFELNICIFRNSTSFDSLTDNSISILLSVNSIKEQGFNLNNKGLLLGDLKNYRHPDLLQNNTPIFYQEMLINNDNNGKFDNYILFNSNNIAVKAIDADLLFVNSDSLIFPDSPEYKPFNPILDVIKSIASQRKIKAFCTTIGIEDIHNMDEIMLINPMKGIQWAVGYKEKRFITRFGKKLNLKINEFAKESIQKGKLR